MKDWAMQYKFTVKPEINLFCECFELAESAARYQGNFDPKSYHLVVNHQNFSKSQDAIDEEFSDVYAYQVKILQEAVPLFDDPLWRKLAEPIDAGGYERSILSAYAQSNDLTKIEDLDYKSFMQMQMSAIGTILYSLGVEEIDVERFEKGSYGKSTWADKIDIHWEDVFELLQLMQVNDEIKIGMLSIFSDSESAHRLFLEKLKACEKIIKKHLPILKDRMEETRLLLEEGVHQEQMIERISALFSLDKFVDMSQNYIKDLVEDDTLHFLIWLGPVSYASGSIGMFSDTGGKPYISVGILLFPLQELSLVRKDQSKERLVEQSKALGDSLRFDILQILQERPYYVKELAERLGISSPSLSHHLKILLNTNFIFATVDEQRMYYHINYDTFEDLANYLLTIRRQEDGAE